MWSDALRVTPQQVDPLSWIARLLVPMSFAIVTVVFGTASTLLSGGLSERSWLDLLSVLLLASGCAWVQVSTGPLAAAFGWGRASVSVLLATAGVAASAIASSASTTPVQLWWAPVGVGLVIASCGPYSSVLSVAVYGGVLTGVTGIAAFAAFGGRSDPWTDLATVVIACSSVVVGTIATAVFCFQVVRHSQRLITRAGLPTPPDERAREEAARVAELSTLVRLGSRVAPFLEAVSDAGEVTAVDRALAGQLARRLRSDLVTQANRSWLDGLALDGHIYVVDPDRRADSMNTSQRAAVRGLVLAIVRDPAIDSGSLFIEMRGQHDGSTAVALSLDIDLPEGRRTMMIAPYFVALKSTVNDISWDPVKELVRFRLPPGERA